MLKPGRPDFALVVVAALVAGSAAACGDGADETRTELEQRRLSILQQFAGLQASIRNAQAQAMDAESVAPSADRFNQVLREKILEIDPDADSLLERAREIGAAIDRLSQPIVLAPGQEPPSSEERFAVAREFGELEQALRPLQEQAMADPEVRSAFEDLQSKVNAEIVRRNPQSEGVLVQMEALSGELEEVDARIRALETAEASGS